MPLKIYDAAASEVCESAGNPHVRFDERGWETERWRGMVRIGKARSRSCEASRLAAFSGQRTVVK
jgi:hypothetical protein